MRLARPFYRFPLRFDAGRLREEVLGLAPDAWVPHPNAIPGNSAVRLISAGGQENDSVHGHMQPTQWLRSSPYICQVLASFGVVWSRSRLMRLAPGADVPEHADINYHWHTRVRLHIPVITRPEVRFHCGDDVVHMAAGEAWVFDNWRLHRVENPTDSERIHLVADTTGTAAFWQLAGQDIPPSRWRSIPWQPGVQAQLLTETNERSAVMPAAEVQLLAGDLRTELVPATDTQEARAATARLDALLGNFTCDWRQLCALHGTSGDGLGDFERLIGAVRAAAQSGTEDVITRTNRINATRVLEARILQHLLSPAPMDKRAGHVEQLLRRPVFIVAAPRSGSTLLFETLACSAAFNTLGGEAHWLIEQHEALRPGRQGADSNRLTADNATPDIAASIRRSAAIALQGPADTAASESATWLEKTPKNALRIPFLDRIFPDARFIFLWRDPRENISSIMEAWRAGRWITYPQLEGWDGPWSLLLPPGWQSLRGAPLEQIAAQQWLRTNQTVLDDLERLPAERWTSVSFAELTQDPGATTRRLCDFLGMPFDAALAQRTASPLPPSRYTHTPPAPEKWRANGAQIETQLPDMQACWQRLVSLR